MRSFMVVFLLAILLVPATSFPHFQMLIPSSDMVRMEGSHTVKLTIVFSHPMEGGPAMEMATPRKMGVYIMGNRIDLIKRLERVKVPRFMPWNSEYSNHRGEFVSAFKLAYTLKRPGDHIFYLVPEPYFEPSEEQFIWQMAKVVVNGFSMEEGWDKPVGMKAEIIPLTRPYGLWEGNTFRGLVLMNGKPAPNLRVEIEYYNKNGTFKSLPDPFITQVVKTDQNGVFSYTIPWAGWWGFSALGDGGTLKRNGKSYPVEMDAVIWVKAYPKPSGVR